MTGLAGQVCCGQGKHYCNNDHTCDCAGPIAGGSTLKQQLCHASVVCDGSLYERCCAISTSQVRVGTPFKQDFGNFIVSLQTEASVHSGFLVNERG